MDLAKRELLLYRIFSGFVRFHIDDTVYIFKSPTAEDRYLAQEIYEEEVKSNRYENWHTKKTILKFLQQQQIFTEEDEEKLDKMEEDIEDLKHKLFTSMLNTEKSNFIRLTLQRTREYMSGLVAAKTCLDHTTVEGYASLLKTQFLTRRCLHYEDGRILEDCPSDFLEKAMSQIAIKTIGQAELRELARTEPWRGYWGASNKQGIFEGLPINYNEDQRSLVLYSKMYDGAYEHPESPEDEVINDDDLFDGWMIHQRKERENTKTKKNIESSINEKQRNAEELYVFAPSTKDANKINDLNTPEAKARRKRRDLLLRRKGELREAELPDKKQEIIMQANRQWSDKLKG